MKKIILGFIVLSSAFSSLFSMAEKAKQKKEALPTPLPAVSPSKVLLPAEKKALSKEPEEEEEIALHLTNNSKWNAVVRYKHTLKGEERISHRLGRKGSKNATLQLGEPDGYTEMIIFPDSPEWRKTIDTSLRQGKIKKGKLIEQIEDQRILNPDDSIQINVTIPKLPGGKFEGFAFEVKPHVVKPVDPETQIDPETQKIIQEEDKKLREEEAQEKKEEKKKKKKEKEKASN